MRNRRMFLLQGMAAFSMWALVAVASWPKIRELRGLILAEGVDGVPMQTLLMAAGMVVVEVVLLAVGLHRVFLVLRTSTPGNR